jgi:hypothetical protein
MGCGVWGSRPGPKNRKVSDVVVGLSDFDFGGFPVFMLQIITTTSWCDEGAKVM